MFNAPKLTNAGKALYYDNMAGTQIVFTTIQLGSGNISGPIAPMTALVTPVVTINAEAKSVSGQYAEISGHFSNAQLADGFYFREIGVFAADPDYPNDRGKDKLYCYQNAYDTADFIPVASVETVEKNITIPVIIGDAAAVSCTLSRSLILASMEDLDNHNKNKNAHEDIRQALTKKQEKITVNGLLKGDGKGGISAQKFDTKPTKDSGNLLTSGAVATAMDVAAALTSAAEYSAAATYAVGAYCTKGGKLYRCTVAILQAEAWNAAHWVETTMGAELVAIYTTLANKAPAGFGLGEAPQHIADANDAVKNGVYAISKSTLNLPGPIMDMWEYTYLKVDVGNRPDAYIKQTITSPYQSWHQCDVTRCFYDPRGGWQPWEWVNPPLLLGVEHRTTGRYLGKPVYCKMVDCGTVPAVGASKTIMVATDAEIFSVSAYSPMRGLGIPFCDANGVKLEINQSGNTLVFRNYSETRSDTNALAVVKYTKTTV